jgi:FemAB-related protein (PEP-CTERM system-associated)
MNLTTFARTISETIRIVPVEKDEAAWDSFVSTAEQGTAYHLFRWKRIISASFGHNAYYLAALDEHGVWRGVLPLVHMKSLLFGNFLVSVPFVNYGGVVSSDSAVARLLLNEADRLRDDMGAAHAELRHVAHRIDELPARQHKVTMILDLAADEELQWKCFNAKLRNQIRKAQKSGLTVAVGQQDLLDGFYEVFARNMRDLGTPVYPKDFFRNVLAAFPESTRIFAVLHQSRIIAAGLAMWFRDTIEVPWASSLNEYKPLCPNNMLYWEVIRFAIGKGFKKLDFGRSTPNEGTFNFKKQWGAAPVQLYWQYLLSGKNQLPDLSPSNPKFGMAIQLWRRLPVPITKVLGPMIVRNIP